MKMNVSLPSPSPVSHGREGSNYGQRWDFPTEHPGTDTQGGGNSLSARVKEEEQRGVAFPKNLPRALGTGVRRAGGSAKTLASGRELHPEIWRFSVKGLSVSYTLSLRAASSPGFMTREWKSPGPLQR